MEHLPTDRSFADLDETGQSLGRRLDASAGFRLLVRAITDALLILDADETVVYVEEGSEAVLGTAPDVLVGRSFRDFVHPDDLGVLPPQIAEDGGPWEVRFQANESDCWTSLAATDPSGLSGPGADGDILEHLEGHVLLFARDIGPERISRDRLDLFRRALDATNNLVVVSDARQEDNPIVFVNQHFLDVTGYDREEVVGENCRFLQVRPDGTRDDDQEGIRKLRQCIGAGEAVHVLIRNYTKDGFLFWNDLFVTPISNQRGEVTHFVGVQNDVTDQVETEADRDQSARLLRTFYDSTPLLMGVLERLPGDALAFRSLNATAAAFFDLDPADIDGQPPADLGLTEAEAEGWLGHAGDCLDKGEPCRFETVFPWGAGSDADGARWFEVALAPIGDGLVSFVIDDVTERRQGEAHRAELTAAIEQAADAVLITDGRLDAPGPTIRYVNRAFEEMTGYARDEVIGGDPRFMQGPMTDRAALDQLRRQLEHGLPYHGELINQTKAGDAYVVAIDVIPIRNDDGEITRFVSTQRDVTEQRRLEGEVLGATSRAQAEIARDLHDGVGQVLAGTAFHLHGLARDLESEGSAYAAQASRAAELVQQAQQQARTLAHGLFPVAVAGDGLAVEIERLTAEAAATYGIVCQFVCDRPFAVHPEDRAADLYRIAQEALGNAIRHGKPTRVVVRLDAPDGRTDPPDGLASLVIEDDGVGFSDDAEEGTGIGVSTMRYRARRVGGTLEITSSPGGGTAVRVRFPVDAGSLLKKPRPRPVS